MQNAQEDAPETGNAQERVPDAGTTRVLETSSPELSRGGFLWPNAAQLDEFCTV